MSKRMETHAHSCYSNIRILDSINTIDDVILTPVKLGLSGVCLTDHECLSGAVDFLNKEKEYKKKGLIPWDFKCAIGNEIYLTDTREKSQKYYHFILIAKDVVGFRQLCEISSKSWYNSYFDRGMERVPTLKSELKEVVEKNKGHIIASTGCIGGEIPSLILQYRKTKNEETKEKINNFILWCKDLFGDDFYLETAPSTNPEQIIVNKTIYALSKVFNVKMIYGTDAHYQLKDRRFVHKAYLNSKEGEREIDSFYEFSHFMDNDEAWEYFQSSYDDYGVFEEMCNNSMEIYGKIGEYEAIFKQPIIPHTEVKNYPKKKMNTGSDILNRLFFSTNQQKRYWVNECWNALEEKGLVNETYINRLAVEANTIEVIGKKLNNCLFEYFNTFKSFIDLFWECGSIVGPGRGSSVCFLSNFLLGITQLDPVEWGLAEWRFLNEERVELPDIDIDLAPSKRPLIFKKIREQRGEMRLLQVATFGTEGTKSAILAACRGYRSDDYPEGIDTDTAQYLSGLIPQERGFLWSLDETVNGNEEKGRKPNRTFINEVSKYPGLLDIMFGIESLVNKRSQHASGVIIYNDDPWKTGAVMRSPNGDLITQFALHQTEALGDTKFDFLVTAVCDKIINTLNLLQKDGRVEENLNLRQIYNKYIHPSVIDIKDDKLWDMLATGEVASLFQLIG